MAQLYQTFSLRSPITGPTASAQCIAIVEVGCCAY